MEIDIPKLEAWKQHRKVIIKKLYDLGKELNDLHKAVTKANIAGSSVALGGIIVGVGLAAAPVSAGTSVVVATGIATAINVAGTGTNIVASIIEKLKTSKKMKEIEKLLKDDERRTSEIHEMVKLLEDAEVSVMSHLESLVEQDVVADTSTVPHPQPIVPAPSFHGNSKQGCSSKKEVLLNKGLEALKKVNFAEIKKFFKIGSKMVTLAKPVIKQGMKSASKEVSSGMEGLFTKFAKFGRFAKYGGLAVNLVAVPFDIYQLVKSSISLKNNEAHKFSNEVTEIADMLEKQMKMVEHELYDAITEFTNFVKLIKIIQQSGCDEHLNSILNQIIKRLLPAKELLPVMENVVDMKPVGTEHTDQKFTCHLMNCEDACSSILTYLSLIIWAAWKAGQKSIICLQNSNIIKDPALWALFGVYIQDAGAETSKGVCTLISNKFIGDVDGHKEFMASVDASIDWKGRCQLVNIILEGHKYCIVNMLSPEERQDRTLFLKEVATFIKKYSEGQLVIAGNFQLEERMMTVDAKDVVKRHLPLSIVRKFAPFKCMAEYIRYKPKGIDAGDQLSWKILDYCQHYEMDSIKVLQVKWSKCQQEMSWEKRDDQLKPITALDTTDVWCKKNSGCIEFSRSDQHRDSKVVTLSQRVDFFVGLGIQDHVTKCSLDHDLRFLGFLKQAVLTLQMKA